MNLTGIIAIVCALTFSACVVLYNAWGTEREGRQRAESALQNAQRNEVEVVKYVDKIVTVEKRVPVARGSLERLCRDFVELPSARPADAAPATDTGDRSLAGLASDIAACKANAEQLSALQEVLRPQVRR